MARAGARAAFGELSLPKIRGGPKGVAAQVDVGAADEPERGSFYDPGDARVLWNRNLSFERKRAGVFGLGGTGRGSAA